MTSRQRVSFMEAGLSDRTCQGGREGHAREAWRDVPGRLGGPCLVWLCLIVLISDELGQRSLGSMLYKIVEL